MAGGQRDGAGWRRVGSCDVAAQEEAAQHIRSTTADSQLGVQQLVLPVELVDDCLQLVDLRQGTVAVVAGLCAEAAQAAHARGMAAAAAAAAAGMGCKREYDVILGTWPILDPLMVTH